MLAGGSRPSRFRCLLKNIEGANHVHKIIEIHIPREDCFVSLLHSHFLVGFEVTKNDAQYVDGNDNRFVKFCPVALFCEAKHHNFHETS